MTEPDTPGATAPPEETNMDRLARVYVKMRSRIGELESEIDKIKSQQDEVAAAMKDLLRATGGTTLKTPHGTVTLKTSKRFYATDWDAMHQFILDNQVPQLLEKRIAQTNMSQFLEANPTLVPPGLNTTSETSVSVTKPRS
jgi:hypothetical protein